MVTIRAPDDDRRAAAQAVLEGMLEQYLDEQEEGPAPIRPLQLDGQGSGFIVSSDGLIVTSAHLVSGAKTLKVEFHDGAEAEGAIIGRDPVNDIALVRITPGRRLVPLAFARRTAPVGSPVAAIGNPFGLGPTVTAGIISSPVRAVPGSQVEFLQTDAAINLGNSGGPLLDERGCVVGLNSALISVANGASGIGFAIPAERIRTSALAILERGEVVRPTLGVVGQNLTRQLAAAFGAPSPQGVLVIGAPGQPASEWLRTGDIVRRYQGQAVADLPSLSRLVADTRPGTTVDIELLRDREILHVRLPVDAAGSGRTERVETVRLAEVGLSLARTAAEADEPVAGATVTSVIPGSAASRAGLRAGDEIRAIASSAVGGLEDLVRRLGAAHGSAVPLLVRRSGIDRFIVIDLGGPAPPVNGAAR